MKRKLLTNIIIFSLIFSMLCSMTGCSSEIQGQNLMEDVEAGDVTGVSDLTEERVVVTDFAVRLFQASEQEGENTLISPLSLLCALAMTANGARGDTLTQMETVLGMSTDELNNYLYSYMKALSQGENGKLSLANSIWFTNNERFSVNKDFLQINADYYGADIYKAPFDNSTLKDINYWVKNETDDMIPRILDKIPEEAVMYLVNALAFEAEWAEVYEDTQVRDGIFTLEDGKTEAASFMYGEEYNYLEDEYAKGFLKYYKECEYAFVALLPNEDISVSEYVATLNGEYLNHMIANCSHESVKTAIPKFETEYSTEMSEVLEKMGMTDAFDDDAADFTGLGTFADGNVFINCVLHKTFISVGEKGTKAGAATAVEMVSKSAAPLDEPKKVYLDRPFVYMLIDCETNVPFFIGTMMEVSE